MSVILRFTAEEEAKALPILLRHSPGTVLPNCTYVVDESIVSLLRDANIAFHEVTPRANSSLLEEAAAGERI
jgi:hypothetical protein